MTDDYEQKKRDARDRLEQFAQSDDGEIDRGRPDVGTMADADEETFLTGFLEGAMEGIVEILLEAGRDTNEWPLNLLDDVQQVYVTQYPWRCPLVVVEVEDCPDWAQVMGATEIYVRDKPALAKSPGAMRYQIRRSR